MKKTAVFTIASRNYFAHVNTLMQSLEATNPDYERFVVCVDEISRDFAALPRNYELVSLESLKLPDFRKMAFRYTILEFNTAVKPWAIEKLLRDHERVIYLDPDICAYRKFTELEALLDGGANMVYTPHLTHTWKADGMQPDEEFIMRCGVYNLGFIAVARSDETRKMVRWWQEKLEYRCVVDFPAGVFVDQKFMDLVPGLFEGSAVLRHEGYNVAYWNMSHRACTKKDGRYFFNGQELAFFHFSGVNVNDIAPISKYQNRHTIDTIGVMRELFERYAEVAQRNSSKVFESFKYAYNVFTDGSPILDCYRYYYRRNPDFAKRCGKDPFSRPDIFNGSAHKEIIWWHLREYWRKNPDLADRFGCMGRDFLLFAKESLRLKDDLLAMFPEACRKYVAERTANSAATPMDKENGVNLVGYIRSEHGVGQACRHTAEALEKTGLPWGAFDWEVNNASRQGDRTWDAKLSGTFPYRYSIFNINADQMPVAREKLPAEAWTGYRIGIWYWELPVFPDEWCDRFDLVDEIWAPTRFIADSISQKATCPVVYMPPPIELTAPADASRSRFGLPEGRFLFLTMFDSLSIQARKNPMAAIAAFKAAFAPDDASVGLVVKVNNSALCADEVAELEKIRGGHGNIHFIKETLERADVDRLLAVCDAAVSLHRSEGLGLLCQEAMCLGKPVIATNWSGNVDFMDNDCACMVDYELRPVGRDFGPYKAWQKWAEADVGQASAYMRRLVSDREFRERISANALRMMSRYSAAACGARMRARLDAVNRILLRQYGEFEVGYADGSAFAEGFSLPENGFRWTEGRHSRMTFALPRYFVGRGLRLTVTAWPFVGGSVAAQRVTVSVRGKAIAERSVSSAGDHAFEIPSECVVDDRLAVDLELPDALAPFDCGFNNDKRKLSLCISKVKVGLT